jgi:NadR type nicotinamide-nucleotide adenylyltransferase
MKVGFTLGKYAPLHHGHQYVIEQGLAETDRMIVMIYNCPETTPCPLPVRAQWLRDLYPQVEVIEAWDGPTMVGYTPEIKKCHEQYILQQLKGQRVTHFYCSELYGDHVSQALNAMNCVVDKSRSKFPVSGTSIRANPYLYRQHISSRVYRDLITNVVFLGAPSTGKTTIADALAKKYHTVWMPEYGREYWEQNQIDRRLSLKQLVEIAETHLVREEKMLYEANRFFFTDTNAITTYMFSLYYHGKADTKLKEFALNAAYRYDITFLCEDDIIYENTWDRSGEMYRNTFQKQIVADLTLRKIPFFRLLGTLEERIETVSHVLERFTKYGNLADFFSIG